MPGVRKDREGGTGTGNRRDSLRFGPLVLLLAIILLTGTGQGMQCLITVNTSTTDQRHPDVSGSRIVWADGTDGSIHLYDLATGAESRVASSPRTQYYPAISGSLVAWQEGNPRGPVRYRNLLIDPLPVDLSASGSSPTVSGQRIAWVNYSGPSVTLSLYEEGDPAPTTLVDDGDTSTADPSLSGDGIVWVNGYGENIAYRNIATGDEFFVISDAAATHANPAISGDRVVWQDDRNGPFDIFLSDLLTEGEQLTEGDEGKENPAIDGTKVAWSMTTSGTTADIYLGLDMAGLASPRSIIGSGGRNNFPRISEEHVVWEKYTGSHYDIYLYNLSSTEPCPVAAFTANVTSGVAPLVVQFNDTSGDPNITSWSWEFGDGATSDEKNATHTFSADGTYSVALTVGSWTGRDFSARTGYIRVGSVPVVSILANRTCGIAPLLVQFNDTSSGSPTGHAWDFGDGETSTEENPLHEYDLPGIYTVNLTATNTLGSGSGTLPEPIQVLNGISRRAVTDIAGLSVLDAGGRQEITLDTGLMDGNTYDPAAPASFSFTPPSSSGWQKITFTSSDGIGFVRDAGGVIRGSLSSCSLESLDIVPATFASGIGNNLPLSYRLDLTSYPVHASVNATVWENATPADALAFRRTLVLKSTQFMSVMDFAYTLHFVSENIDPGIVTGASLNLSVASSWVAAEGGGNNITTIRLGDDGIDGVLNPAAMTTDATAGLDHFTVPSPHGLSRFALVSATGSSNLLQMGARVATHIIQGSGMGAGSSDQPVARDRSPWVQPAALAGSPQPPAPTFYGEARLDTTVAGITRGAMIISADDHGANLLVPAGIEALDASRAPLARVSVSPVPSGGTFAVTGAGFTGIVYDIGPDGATFNPPATLSFTLPEASWSEESVYTIRVHDGATGAWTDIPTTADKATRTLTGEVSRLCLFGVFAAPAAGGTPAALGEAPTAATPAPTREPVPRTPMGTFTGMLAWIYATALAHPVATGLLLAAAVLLSLGLVARRRRSRITHIRRKG